MKTLTSIFFLLLTIWLSAQDSTENTLVIDSLVTAIDAHRSLDRAKVDMLNQVAYEYWIIDPEQGETYASQALEIARILPYAEGAAFANRSIGVTHWVRGNPELAFRFLLDAERTYREIDDSLGLANSMLNLGMVYADQLNFAAAKNKYAQALGLFTRLEESSRIATTYTKEAEVLIQEGAYEPAYDRLTAALEIHRANDFLYGVAEVNSKLGKLFVAREDYNSAISYFLLAVEAGKARSDHVGLADAYHEIARCYFLTGNVAQAAGYLRQSETLAEEFHLNKIRREVYATAKDLALERGDYRNAVRYYDQFLAVKDSLFNEEKSNIIAGMQARQAFAEKARELELAQRRLDLLVEQKKTDRLTLLALVLGIFTVAALGWGIVQRKNKLLTHQQRDLDQAQEKTDELEDLIQTKEKELTSYTLNFVQKNEIIGELKRSINTIKKELTGPAKNQLNAVVRQLDTALNVDRDWADFRKHFEHVHPRLIQRLNAEYPTLTKNEFKLIALLRLNLSSKEISAVFGISPDSAKTARYRLRKKLGLENQEELFDFLLRYEKQT